MPACSGLDFYHTCEGWSRFDHYIPCYSNIVFHGETSKVDAMSQPHRSTLTNSFSFCLLVQKTFLCLLMLYMCMSISVHIIETSYGSNSYEMFRAGLLTPMLIFRWLSSKTPK